MALLVGALAALLGAGTPSRLSNSEAEFLSHETESYETARLMLAAAGRQAFPNVGVLFPAAPGPVNARVLAAVRSAAKVTLAPFYSRDHRAEAVVGLLRPGAPPGAAAERLARRLGRFHDVSVGGTALAGEEFDELITHDLFESELIGFPLLVLLGFLVFRSLTSALLPATVGALAFALTLCCLRPINAVKPLSIFSLNIVAGLAVGLSIDYSLLLVSRFREELARVRGPAAGQPPGRLQTVTGSPPLNTSQTVTRSQTAQAAYRTVATAGRTVTFSAATVAAAFASLLVFGLGVIRSIAIGGMLVAGIAGTVSLVVLPAIFALLGDGVNTFAPERWQRSCERAGYREERGFWYRLAAFVVRRPARVALAVTVPLLVAGLPVLGMRLMGFDSAALPHDTPGHRFEARVKSEFEHPIFDEVISVAHGPSAYVHGVVARYMEHLPDVRTGFAWPLRPQLWAIDLAVASAPFSSASKRLVRRLRALPVHLAVTGATADYVDTAASLLARLPYALALLAASMFAVLFLATGSVVLPLKTVIMNLLSLSVAFGALVLVFQDGRLQGPLQYHGLGALVLAQPIVLGTGTFGILTDYGIFLLTRIKEGWDAGLSNREAIVVGLERTGRIVTAAALLFCVAVGTLLSAQLVYIKEVGLGTVVAVAVDATLVRALLVPSLMTLLGRWNWWRPRLPVRLETVLGLRPQGAGVQQ